MQDCAFGAVAILNMIIPAAGSALKLLIVFIGKLILSVGLGCLLSKIKPVRKIFGLKAD